MLHLLAQEAPPENLTFLDVLIWPVAMTLVGGLLFYFGWWVENRLAKAPWKWLALIPLGYGLFVGVNYLMSYNDPFYEAALVGGGRKMLVAHYAAAIIPALGVIGVFLFHFFSHKLNISVDD